MAFKKSNFFILNITLIVAACIFVLAMVEFILRFIPRFDMRFPLSPVVQNISYFEVRRKDAAIFRPSPLLGYEYIPNSRSEFWAINSYGMIGREHEFKKKAGIFRILLLGDSIATHECTAEFLESKTYNSDKGRFDFEVWNAGVGSYDIRRYALFLKHKGLKFNPDMVLIYFCLNDFYLNTCVYYKDENGVVPVFHLQEIDKFYHPDPILLKRSYLYRFIVLSLDNYLSKKRSKGGINSELKAARYYLGQIKDVCRKRKISLLGVIFPSLRKREEYTSGESRGYKNILEALRDFKIDYIDLHDYWPDEMRPKLRNQPYDYVHPSREGHKMVVEIIYDYLTSKGIPSNRQI